MQLLQYRNLIQLCNSISQLFSLAIFSNVDVTLNGLNLSLSRREYKIKKYDCFLNYVKNYGSFCNSNFQTTFFKSISHAILRFCILLWRADSYLLIWNYSFVFCLCAGIFKADKKTVKKKDSHDFFYEFKKVRKWVERFAIYLPFGLATTSERRAERSFEEFSGRNKS